MDYSLGLWDYFASVVLHKLKVFQIDFSFLNKLSGSWHFRIYGFYQILYSVTDETVGFRVPSSSYICVETATSANIVCFALCAGFTDENLLQFQRIRLT